MAFHSTLELSEEVLILIKVEQLLSESVFNYNQTYACFFKVLSHTQRRIQKNSLRKAQG